MRLAIGSALLCALLPLALAAADSPAVKDSDLLQIVVARSEALKGTPVYVEMAGGATRARFIAADKSFLTVEYQGQTMPVPWKMVKSEHLLGIAAQAAATVDELLLVARYAQSTDRIAIAEKALERALEVDVSRAKDIQELQAQIKPKETPKPVATSTGTGSTPAARPFVPAGPWQCLGPGGGGAMYTPTISPHDPKVGIITCDMSGVYLTRDGGRHWRVLPGMRYGHAVAFSSTDPNAIFLGVSDKLYRSPDLGATWLPATPDRQYPLCKCWDVIVDPDDGRFVWATFGSAGEAGSPISDKNKFMIDRSQDGGLTFKEAWVGLPKGSGMVKKLAVDRTTPVGNRTVYAATSEGLYRSRDGGGQWDKAGKGLPHNLRQVVTLYDKAGNKSVVLASGDPGGVYRSEDGGETFTPSGKGLSDKDDGGGFVVEQMAAAWNDPNLVYAAGTNLSGSSDGGRTWRKLYPDANKFGSWLAVFKPWSHDSWRGVGCNPKNAKQVWVTGDMPFFASDDGGATFTETNGHPMPDGTPRWNFKEQFHKTPPTAAAYYDGGGLEVTFCYQVIADPLRPDVYYACYADIGTFRTEDGGKSWTYNSGIWNVGIKSEWRNSCYEIAVDKRNPGRIYGVFSGLHNLPQPDPGKAGKYNIGGVAVSPDGGKTWTPFEKSGLPEKPCTSVILDRRSDTLYVALYGVGVFRSNDGGKSFAEMSAGLGGGALAWRLRQTPDNTLYLVCAYGKPGGVWKYDEGKAAWSRVDTAPAFADVRDIVVMDSGKEREKFLAVAVEGADGGVYASNDGGTTWKKVYAKAARSVECSPDGRIWVAAGGDGLHRSMDSGATWTDIKEFPFPYINDVTLNPRNPGELWVGTAGCGVFKGF